MAWYDEFRAASSAGILPNEKPAKSMRYKRAMIWQVDLALIGIGGGEKSGEWTVTISNEDESIIFFKQAVTLKLFLVALGAPGLILFTWNYVKDTFDTSVVGGVATSEENIGSFLLGGTAASEQGDMQPASGQDSTDLTATIISDWYSPIYLFTGPGGRNLPPGYKVKVSHDTWGFGPASVEYGWAFEDGGAAQIGTTFDGFGALLTATNEGDFTRTGRAWGVSLGDKELGAAVEGISPTILEMPTGLEILVLQIPSGIAEFESRDSEWTWQRVKYPSIDENGGLNIDNQIEMLVWDGDYTMPQAILLRDGKTRFHLALDGSILYSRLVDGDGIGGRLAVGPLEDGGAFSAEEAPDGSLLVIGDEGKPIYESKSIPPSWKPVESTPTEVTT